MDIDAGQQFANPLSPLTTTQSTNGIPPQFHHQDCSGDISKGPANSQAREEGGGEVEAVNGACSEVSFSFTPSPQQIHHEAQMWDKLVRDMTASVERCLCTTRLELQQILDEEQQHAAGSSAIPPPASQAVHGDMERIMGEVMSVMERSLRTVIADMQRCRDKVQQMLNFEQHLQKCFSGDRGGGGEECRNSHDEQHQAMEVSSDWQLSLERLFDEDRRAYQRELYSMLYKQQEFLGRSFQENTERMLQNVSRAVQRFRSQRSTEDQGTMSEPSSDHPQSQQGQ